MCCSAVSVSGAHGTLVAEQILENQKEFNDFLEREDEPGPWPEEYDKSHTVGGLSNDKDKSFMKFVNNQK